MRPNTVFLAILGLSLLAGCQSAQRHAAEAVYARFFLEMTGPGATTVVRPGSEVRLSVSPKPVLSEFDIADVQLVQVDLGRCLLFQLTPAAARDLYRLSASNQGSRLVLFLNGQPAGARRIEAPLSEGSVLIFVEQPDATLPALVARLKQTAADLQKKAARKR